MFCGLEEIPTPEPAEGEVRVAVRASSINAGDWHLMRGDPTLMRLAVGLFRPKFRILGADVAGVVDAVGPGVTAFQRGDEVFGDISRSGFGGFAEYVCANENELVLKPSKVSFEAAAAVPAAAMTALQGLRDVGNIQPGDAVLINGASGGVGMFGVQLARALGAEVTAVGSAAKLDMVSSLGADHVIDYTKVDVTRGEARYDLVLDAAAFRSIRDYRGILSPGGVYVLAGGSTRQFLEILLVGPWASRGGVKMKNFLLKPNTRDLRFLSGLIETGEVRPVIDRTFPLEQVPDAIRHVEARKTRGKVVITVETG